MNIASESLRGLQRKRAVNSAASSILSVDLARVQSVKILIINPLSLSRYRLDRAAGILALLLKMLSRQHYALFKLWHIDPP